VELRTAITRGKWSSAQEDPLCHFQREVRLTSSWNFQRVTKNEEMVTLWRGRPSFETKKETADTAGAGNVEAPAPTERERERERQREENFG
jgi:hypothetical protein